MTPFDPPPRDASDVREANHLKGELLLESLPPLRSEMYIPFKFTLYL
jgi:hypothetical protein